MRKGIVIVCILLLVCSVTLCACDGNIVEENAKFVELSTWHFTSGVPNNLIRVKHSNPNAKFQLTTDKGKFVEYPDWPQTVTLDNDDIISWQGLDGKIDLAYVDIIVTIDDNIVGYAVIQIVRHRENLLYYDAAVVKSVVFPQVDGQYQKVSQKQIEAKIKAAKG